MRYTGIITMIMLLQFGCKPKQGASTIEQVVSQENLELTWTEPRDTTSLLQIKKGDSVKFSSDPVNILKAQIIDHQLWLTVSYGGGCEEHQFEMYFNRTFKDKLNLDKGEKNGVELSLVHEGNNDRCRAIVQQNLRFNLKDLELPKKHNALIKLLGWKEELKHLP